MRAQDRRIIVVEDHADSLDLLLTVARASAVDCVGAATVEEARRVFLERRPDLVITDYNLPDGNGLDLLRWIRTVQRAHDLIAVVLVSAHRERETLRDEAAVSGALFLPKPIDAGALHEAIEAALQRC